MARSFVAEGAQVLVADINGEAAATVAASIGSSARPFTADVASREQVQGWLRRQSPSSAIWTASSTTRVIPTKQAAARR